GFCPRDTPTPSGSQFGRWREATARLRERTGTCAAGQGEPPDREERVGAITYGAPAASVGQERGRGTHGRRPTVDGDRRHRLECPGCLDRARKLRIVGRHAARLD